MGGEKMAGWGGSEIAQGVDFSALKDSLGQKFVHISERLGTAGVGSRSARRIPAKPGCRRRYFAHLIRQY